MVRQAMLFGNESGTGDNVDDCKLQFQSGNQLRLKRVAFVLRFLDVMLRWEFV